jgi:hypothetical protein
VEPPAVPGYAWDWLQRSRPVVERLADVLTGQPPRPGFVQAVRRSFGDDPLVRDAVCSVIADIAFRGRVPTARPAGVSWDRGLVWWAALLAGRSPDDYARPTASVEQPALFASEVSAPTERQVVIAALRDLLAHRTGDQVPAAAVRQLIHQLEQGPDPDAPHR